MKPNTILFEIAWEVCNQIGGIFTYIKSRIPTMLDTYGENYFLIGPHFPEKARLDFRPVNVPDNTALSETIVYIRSLGFEIHYGHWLLDDSRPPVLLINPKIDREKLNQVKGRFWEKHKISTIIHDETTDQVIGFSEVVTLLLTHFIERISVNQDVVAHYHEWMAAASLPELIDNQVRLATVFTTHATVLGRYLAPNETDYFNQLADFEWISKSKRYGVEISATLERLAAQKAHVLVSNSRQTSAESEVFLGRRPDSIIRNGINKKPGTGHEAFVEHQENRSKLDAFVKAFFTPSYPVQAEKALYFFTSGRFEYKNKGFNLTLEAAARLNAQLIREKSDMTIVLFVVSKRPFHTIKPEVLETKKRFQDLKGICKEISAKLGPRIYANVTGNAHHKIPDLNALIDEELLATWKQAISNFKREGLPPVSTHQLVHEDEVTDFLRVSGLDNSEHNRVKVIYYPDFIERTISLFGMDFLEFIRGCNLGIFPALYEPWGNTTMETVLQGTPVIGSNTSGFFNFISENLKSYEDHELKIVDRMFQSEEEATKQLTEQLYQFTETFQKQQFVPRTSLPKNIMDSLCWTELQQRYQENYQLALLRAQPVANLY